MNDDGITQMSDIAPTFDQALSEVQDALRDTRREWSGVLMSLFPQKLWMFRRARRLRRQLHTGSVEFNAICEGTQVTICSSRTTKQATIPQDHSLCVITVSVGAPLAVDDTHTAAVVKGHPAQHVCRAWASYPVMVNGTAAGTVCALDSPHPRAWSKRDEQALEQAALDLGDRITAWLRTQPAT